MYAIRQDLIQRFSSDEVEQLEQASNVEEALRDAFEEAQSYVSMRYAPPLPNVPAPLVVATCDIARFRLYKTRPTDEVKYRYERAVKWLEALAAGRVALTFDPVLTPEQVAGVVIPEVIPVGAVQTGGVFSDRTLGLMPNIDGYAMGNNGYRPFP